MTSKLDRLNQWVAEVARLTRPDAIHWCDGSDAENAALIDKMLADGTLQLRTDAGLRSVISGDVSVRPIHMALPPAAV